MFHPPSWKTDGKKAWLQVIHFDITIVLMQALTGNQPRHESNKPVNMFIFHQIIFAGDTLSNSYILRSTIPLTTCNLHFPFTLFSATVELRALWQWQLTKTESALINSLYIYTLSFMPLFCFKKNKHLFMMILESWTIFSSNLILQKSWNIFLVYWRMVSFSHFLVHLWTFH